MSCCVVVRDERGRRVGGLEIGGEEEHNDAQILGWKPAIL